MKLHIHVQSGHCDPRFTRVKDTLISMCVGGGHPMLIFSGIIYSVHTIARPQTRMIWGIWRESLGKWERTKGAKTVYSVSVTRPLLQKEAPLLAIALVSPSFTPATGPLNKCFLRECTFFSSPVQAYWFFKSQLKYQFLQEAFPDLPA